MKVLLSRFGVALLTLLLGACAGQVNMVPPLDQQTILGKEQGVLVARVINASSNSLPYNQLTIVPENYNESEQIKMDRLVAPQSAMNGTTVFASPVKAGRYSLNNVRAFHSGGQFWYSDFIGTNSKFGTFEVRPGKVTDLGTLIYYPKSEGAKYIKTLLRKPDSATGSVLNEHFPAFSVKKNNLLTWHDDGRDSERFENYIFAVQNPVTLKQIYRAPDGTLYFLGKLGFIFKRTPDGRWLNDAVDTDYDLNAIAVNHYGDTVVGGSEGRMFLKRGQKHWLNISLNREANIEEVAFVGWRDVDVIAREETRLVVYRLNITRVNEGWRLVNSFTTDKGWQNLPKEVMPDRRTPRERIANIKTLEWGGKHYITVNSHSTNLDPMFANSSSEMFLYNPSNWAIAEVKDEPPISSVLDAGVTKMGIKRAGFWSWDGRPDYFRYDIAKNEWQEMKTSMQRCSDGSFQASRDCSNVVDDSPNARKRGKTVSFQFVSVPWFESNLTGYAAVTFPLQKDEDGKVIRKLLKTIDGGLNWSEAEGDLPKPWCLQIVPHIEDRLLLTCNGSSTDFYESRNGGVDWRHVRQHGNF